LFIQFKIKAFEGDNQYQIINLTLIVINIYCTYC